MSSRRSSADPSCLLDADRSATTRSSKTSRWGPTVAPDSPAKARRRCSTPSRRRSHSSHQTIRSSSSGNASSSSVHRALRVANRSWAIRSTSLWCLGLSPFVCSVAYCSNRSQNRPTQPSGTKTVAYWTSCPSTSRVVTARTSGWFDPNWGSSDVSASSNPGVDSNWTKIPSSAPSTRSEGCSARRDSAASAAAVIWLTRSRPCCTRSEGDGGAAGSRARPTGV